MEVMKPASGSPSAPTRLPARGLAPPLRETFAALRHRNYRLWFAGQLISMIGWWMQNTAQGYLVYDLTRSRAWLGYVGFAAGLPAWLFTLYGGVIADRVSRRGLLVVTQSAMLALALALAALVFTGVVRPWQILVLALLAGVANAFDAPARQAIVVDLAGREDLTNAIALNSTLFNVATVVGPAIGGAVYALAGPGWCFAANGVTYLAVIAALLLMRLSPPPPSRARASVLADLREGFGYLRDDVTTRVLIAVLGVFSLVAVGLVTLMPAWAVNVLGGDVRTNGLLLSARGAGALAGALMIAALARRARRGRLLTLGNFLLPLTLLAFAAARAVPVALGMMVGIGWSFMIIVNSTNSLVQTRLPDALRGRVMSIYTMVFFGSMPLGALLAGGAAGRFGEAPAVAGGALLLLGAALLFRLRWPGVTRLS